jgi:hypothetical protein
MRAAAVGTLRAELCELSTVVTELQRVIAAERAKVLDLPPLAPGELSLQALLFGVKPEAFAQFLRHLAF